MNLKRKNKISAEFSMASMTDIIFLLLIFFMITSSAISQSAIEVKLPQATQGDATIQNSVSVTISKEGNFYVNEKSVSREDLESVLLSEINKSHLSGFTIKADGDARHKDVVFVMEIAEKNQLGLAIATTVKEEK